MPAAELVGAGLPQPGKRLRMGLGRLLPPGVVQPTPHCIVRVWEAAWGEGMHGAGCRLARARAAHARGWAAPCTVSSHQPLVPCLGAPLQGRPSGARRRTGGRTVRGGRLLWEAVGGVSEGICSRGGPRPSTAQHPQDAAAAGRVRQAARCAPTAPGECPALRPSTPQRMQTHSPPSGWPSSWRRSP